MLAPYCLALGEHISEGVVKVIWPATRSGFVSNAGTWEPSSHKDPEKANLLHGL